MIRSRITFHKRLKNVCKTGTRLALARAVGAEREVAMKQAILGLNLSTKKTRKREFLDYMERGVPWSALVAIVEPHCPRSKTGRPPFAVGAAPWLRYSPSSLTRAGGVFQTILRYQKKYEAT